MRRPTIIQASHSWRKIARNLTKPMQRSAAPKTAKRVPSSTIPSLLRKPRMIPPTISITALCKVSANDWRSPFRILSTIFLAKMDQPVELMLTTFKSCTQTIYIEARPASAAVECSRFLSSTSSSRQVGRDSEDCNEYERDYSGIRHGDEQSLIYRERRKPPNECSDEYPLHGRSELNIQDVSHQHRHPPT